MSLDQFFHRHYTDDYICTHHAAEVWKALTGEDIFAKIGDVVNGGIKKRHVEAFAKLDAPQDPCLALLRHRRHDNKFHMGVYHQGRIMHLTPRGVHNQPVDVVKIGFSEVVWFR